MRDDRLLWFVVADRSSARLLGRGPGPSGELRVLEKARLVLTTTTEAPRRPVRAGLDAGATAEPESDGRLGHFARLLCDWLPRLLDQHLIASCPLFAPADLLAEVHRAASPELAVRLVPEEAELGDLTSLRLAEHPRIAGLVPA